MVLVLFPMQIIYSGEMKMKSFPISYTDVVSYSADVSANFIYQTTFFLNYNPTSHHEFKIIHVRKKMCDSFTVPDLP